MQVLEACKALDVVKCRADITTSHLLYSTASCWRFCKASIWKMVTSKGTSVIELGSSLRSFHRFRLSSYIFSEESHTQTNIPSPWPWGSALSSVHCIAMALETREFSHVLSSKSSFHVLKITSTLRKQQQKKQKMHDCTMHWFATIKQPYPHSVPVVSGTLVTGGPSHQDTSIAAP